MEWREKSVLIAEDEDTNFMLLVEYLESTGIQIHRASNGKQAVDFCLNNKPDIILMDMKMPVMSGYEAVEKLRSMEISIPVLAQTAYTMMGDKEKIIQCGCDDYLAKPIEEEMLILKMSKYLEL